MAGHYKKKYGKGLHRWNHQPRMEKGKYQEWRGPGERCPDKTYKKRYGKSKGWCVTGAARARRKPCSMMTRRGRRMSTRCKDKKFARI
jgi:hypothetical protein